jgi:uncharacterized membrane protein YoaK (UPF0700 family)
MAKRRVEDKKKGRKGIDIKTFKTIYMIVAGILMLGAIAAVLLQHTFVALGLIVASAMVILVGALIVSYMFRYEKVRDVD